MSLPEKMYDDFKHFVKGAITAIIVTYVVYIYILAVGLSDFWYTGHYFWAIALGLDVVVGALVLGSALGSLLRKRMPGFGTIVLAVGCLVISLILCGYAGTIE